MTKKNFNETVNGVTSVALAKYVEIKTKYCSSANKSVNAAFKNGQYRYPGMKLEVPKDQYDEAVHLVKGRIIDGRIPGVTDPKMAEQIVVKGYYTFDEAISIAKACTYSH